MFSCDTHQAYVAHMSTRLNSLPNLQYLVTLGREFFVYCGATGTYEIACVITSMRASSHVQRVVSSGKACSFRARYNMSTGHKSLMLRI